jgi:hypothetical protein
MRKAGIYRLLVDPVTLLHSSWRLEEPSSFEEAHAWQNVMEIGSEPIKDAMNDSRIQDVVIASCTDGYYDTSTAYKIDISSKWEIVVSRYVILYEDVRSSSSQDSPLVIEENVEVLLEIHLRLEMSQI